MATYNSFMADFTSVSRFELQKAFGLAHKLSEEKYRADLTLRGDRFGKPLSVHPIAKCAFQLQEFSA